MLEKLQWTGSSPRMAAGDPAPGATCSTRLPDAAEEKQGQVGGGSGDEAEGIDIQNWSVTSPVILCI